ncbi:MAG: hypothetical protein HDR05_12550 [Lachnospiraceae bacterium]|nr:hypothetical protein [Lachnospiraceae bacterium]
MARKKREVVTPEEQLEKVIKDIEETKETLKTLEKSKKELEAQIKMDRLAELDAIIKDSGKSYDEVKAMLSK